eukprot:gene3507-663_t
MTPAVDPAAWKDCLGPCDHPCAPPAPTETPHPMQLTVDARGYGTFLKVMGRNMMRPYNPKMPRHTPPFEMLDPSLPTQSQWRSRYPIQMLLAASVASLADPCYALGLCITDLKPTFPKASGGFANAEHSATMRLTGWAPTPPGGVPPMCLSCVSPALPTGLSEVLSDPAVEPLQLSTPSVLALSPSVALWPVVSIPRLVWATSRHMPDPAVPPAEICSTTTWAVPFIWYALHYTHLPAWQDAFFGPAVQTALRSWVLIPPPDPYTIAAKTELEVGHVEFALFDSDQRSTLAFLAVLENVSLYTKAGTEGQGEPRIPTQGLDVESLGFLALNHHQLTWQPLALGLPPPPCLPTTTDRIINHTTPFLNLTALESISTAPLLPPLSAGSPTLPPPKPFLRALRCMTPQPPGIPQDVYAMVRLARFNLTVVAPYLKQLAALLSAPAADPTRPSRPAPTSPVDTQACGQEPYSEGQATPEAARWLHLAAEEVLVTLPQTLTAKPQNHFILSLPGAPAAVHGGPVPMPGACCTTYLDEASLASAQASRTWAALCSAADPQPPVLTARDTVRTLHQSTLGDPAALPSPLPADTAHVPSCGYAFHLPAVKFLACSEVVPNRLALLLHRHGADFCSAEAHTLPATIPASPRHRRHPSGVQQADLLSTDNPMLPPSLPLSLPQVLALPIPMAESLESRHLPTDAPSTPMYPRQASAAAMMAIPPSHSNASVASSAADSSAFQLAGVPALTHLGVTSLLALSGSGVGLDTSKAVGALCPGRTDEHVSLVVGVVNLDLTTEQYRQGLYTVVNNIASSIHTAWTPDDVQDEAATGEPTPAPPMPPSCLLCPATPTVSRLTSVWCGGLSISVPLPDASQPAVGPIAALSAVPASPAKGPASPTASPRLSFATAPTPVSEDKAVFKVGRVMVRSVLLSSGARYSSTSVHSLSLRSSALPEPILTVARRQGGSAFPMSTTSVQLPPGHCFAETPTSPATWLSTCPCPVGLHPPVTKSSENHTYLDAKVTFDLYPAACLRLAGIVATPLKTIFNRLSMDDPQVLSLDHRMALSHNLVLFPSVLLHVPNSSHNHVILDGCGHSVVFVSSADEDVCSDLLAWVLSYAPPDAEGSHSRLGPSASSVLSTGAAAALSPLPYEYTPATRPLVRIDDGATLEISRCRLVFEMGDLEDWLSK